MCSRTENSDVQMEYNIPSTQKNSNTENREWMRLGENFLSVGDPAEAQKCFEKAAVQNPDDAAPYVGLGAVAIQNNLLDDAQLAYRVACRLDSQSSKAYEGLGRVAQIRKQHEQAFEMFLKCLKLDTDNLMALLGLFQTSAEMGSFAKIIHYLEVYREKHPNDCSVMFSLATLYIKDNQFEQSKAMLLRVLEVIPDNTEAVNLLEEVEYNLSRQGSV